MSGRLKAETLFKAVKLLLPEVDKLELCDRRTVMLKDKKGEVIGSYNYVLGIPMESVDFGKDYDYPSIPGKWVPLDASNAHKYHKGFKIQFSDNKAFDCPDDILIAQPEDKDDIMVASVLFSGDGVISFAQSDGSEWLYARAFVPTPAKKKPSTPKPRTKKKPVYGVA